MRRYFVFPLEMPNFHDRNSSNLLCLILSYPSDAELHLEMVQNDVPTHLSHSIKWTHPMGWAQRNHNIPIFCRESRNESRGRLSRRCLWNARRSSRKADKTLHTAAGLGSPWGAGRWAGGVGRNKVLGGFSSSLAALSSGRKCELWTEILPQNQTQLCFWNH